MLHRENNPVYGISKGHIAVEALLLLLKDD